MKQRNVSFIDSSCELFGVVSLVLIMINGVTGSVSATTTSCIRVVLELHYSFAFSAHRIPRR